ncbi:MAG: SAM-dependent methyltransferase, partial [Candidatus Bathyarchaeum sp.]
MTLDWQEALKKLELLTQKPPLFESGEQTFWDDPHISKQLLNAHLDAETDVASRKHKTIDKEVEHLFKSGILKPNDRVLDLGCGPGLYSSRLADRGINVTGIDMSTNSLDYAKSHAETKGYVIDYLQMDFFNLDFKEQFDAILQTNGELNTFSNAQRDVLLK